MTDSPLPIEGSLKLRPLHPSRHAWFLDVDGTLLAFVRRPEEIRADSALLSLLLRLERDSGGALALISGRTIASLDQITMPHRFAAAGIHGLERRDARGVYTGRASSAPLDGARAAFQAFAAQYPQLLLEDKGVGLALHFRTAPELAVRTTAEAFDVAKAYPDLRVQEGHMVVELLPHFAGKAHALAAFMEEPPFSGRTPVFVGDDLTDEPAFAWTNAAGGLSVAVGAHQRQTAALAGLPTIAAVREWLGSAVAWP